MKNVKFLILIAALLLVFLYLCFGREILFSSKSVQKLNILNSKHNIPEAESLALSFVMQHMSGPQLSIYTNYLNTGRGNDEIASGQDVLLESQGLLLLYLLNHDEKESFDLCLDWTVDNLYLGNGMFSWVKRKTSKAGNSSALIDDFRILRALTCAYEKWNDDRYLVLTKDVSSAILSNSTLGGRLVDFYDLSSKDRADYITISYLDLYTMEKLAYYDAKWEDVYSDSLELVRNAKIDGTGLYMFQYDLGEKSFGKDEEINLIQSLYVMLHLKEAGQFDKEGINWIWDQYEKFGKLYAVYSSSTLKPLSDIESTALYALAARLFYLSGDMEKAQTLLLECEKFQVKNKNSEIYGSFGNEVNLEVYSFDNLQYILSSSIIYSSD